MDTKLKEGEQLKSVWNKRFSDWTPNEIFCPTTADDVLQVVKHFKANEIPFVVRSGGHSGSGKSSINGGGLISLHKMKNIEIDDKNQKISFQTGCTLGDLDTAGELAQSKNYTPWGTVSFTGVGGLILHGGIGLLSKRRGLSIDNIVEIELVTESGTVVINQNSEPELFWACRGGASLFGVATRVAMQTHHIPYSYGGTVCTINDELSEYIPYFIRLNKEEPEYSGYLYLVPTPASLIILNMSVVTNPDKINVLEPFMKGPVIYGQFSEQSVWQINKSSADFFAKAPPVRQLWKSVSIDNDDNILEVLDAGLEFVKTNRLNEGSVIVIEYWSGKMAENNGNTCYNRRHKGCTLSFFFGWQDPTQDEHFIALITQFISSLTTSTESSYINTNPGTSNCFDQQTRDRLLALKEKWDPKGIFSGQLRI